MSPSEIRRQRDALSIRETIWMGGGCWMHVGHDGTVYLSTQRKGEAASGSVEIPRETFAKMVEWYFRNQE